jgi:hypothetical protein
MLMADSFFEESAFFMLKRNYEFKRIIKDCKEMP